MKLFIVCFSLTVCLSEQTTPSVNLPLGIVEGYTKETVNGRTFSAFEGVPYARPPVGKYRFKEAVPLNPWIGVWKATTLYKCIQYNHYTPPGQDMVIGEEDCLYVNIYTPDVNPKKKFDVLVYIHGGAFMFNSGGLYGPEIILDRDVVYVNLNYRLGPLGFLSTEDNELPGNNGLRDQILALKWVKQNIQYFGGDPNSITISGMSAGGASVQFHYLFRESKGLFKGGISQSGCILNPWVLMEKSLEKAKKVSNIVGCPTNDNKFMVDCLKKKPARQIVQAVGHFQPFLYNPFSPFAPVVDSWAKNPLIPEHPYVLLQKKKVQDLPWLISYVSGEGLYPGADFYFDKYLEHLENNWNKILPYILHYNDVIPENRLDSVSEKIRLEYMKGEKLTKKTFNRLIQAMSDRLFIYDIEKGARLHNDAVNSPVFSYYFTYRGAHSGTDLKTNSNEDIGVSHADDTGYILKMKVDTLSTPQDREMSRIMVDMFTSFMDTGIIGSAERIHGLGICVLAMYCLVDRPRGSILTKMFPRNFMPLFDVTSVFPAVISQMMLIRFFVYSTTSIFIVFIRKPNVTTHWRPLSKEKSAPWIQLHISNPKEMYVEEIVNNLGNREFWDSLGFEENENLLRHDEL